MKFSIITTMFLLAMRVNALCIDSTFIKIDTMNNHFHKYPGPFQSFQKDSQYKVTITDSTIEISTLLFPIPPTLFSIERIVEVDKKRMYFLQVDNLLKNFSSLNYYRYMYKLIYEDGGNGSIYCILLDNKEELVIAWTSFCQLSGEK